MKELEEIDFDDTTKGFTKKELLIQKRELVKLQKTLGGIRNLTKTPSAIWIVDAKREHLAVNEATKLGIPIIGILDTNADPDELQYPIPGNDDAIRSVGLLTRIIADAAAEGLVQRHSKPDAEGNVSAVEPLAEWEAELLHASEGATTQENDADAVVAEHEAAADATIVPEHAPESDAATEAKIEAEATDAEKKPVKPAAKKPAAKKADADAEKPAKADKADKADKAEKPAAKAKPAAKKPAAK
jgi:small subunit ribosomal protein S2